jgi:Family of unknown function (DUF5989)
MSFAAEFLRFLFTRKKYWMAPAILFLVIVGGLLVVAHGSVVAPLIYTLF